MEQPSKKKRICLIYVALTLATILAFEPMRHNEFVNYDDSVYVTKNPHVKAGITRDSTIWAFTTTYFVSWHPLTWLSHMLDCQLFGLNPVWHHLTSLLFHVANTILLFWVLKKMTGAIWPSTFVAAVFALHPLRVESVAWLAERKDVLSGLFWMLTMAAYIQYVQRPNIRRYLPVFLFLGLGLMAKPMIVTLPFVLLLLDYWPLRRFQMPHQREDRHVLKAELADKASLSPGRLIIEKIPLFLLVAALCIITFVVQRGGGAIENVWNLPFPYRIANILVAYVKYIGKIIYPTRLTLLYPHPGDTLPLWQPIIALLILVAISALAIYTARRRPFLIVGWLWYLGTLIPVIGLVQVGTQSMADRYSYLPSIGFSIMVAWAAAQFLTGKRYQRICLCTTAVLVLLVLLICTRIQVKYWRDNKTLFGHALNVTKDNHIMHINYGNTMIVQGRLGEAVRHFTRALEIEPHSTKAHHNLGIALVRQKRFDEAIEHFQEAIRIEHVLGATPGAAIYNRLGMAYYRKGAYDPAVQSFKECLRLYPDFASAHKNLARLVMGLKNPDAAIRHLTEAIQINPNIGLTHFNLALALKSKGRTEEAITHFREALRIKPNWERPMNSLAWILATHSDSNLRDPQEALTLALRACELVDYQNPGFLNTLAAAYAAAGRFSDAVATTEKAIQIIASGNKKERASQVQNRLDLYRQQKPYRQP